MVMRCVFHGVRNVYLHSGFVRLPHRKVHTLSSLPSTLCTLPTRWNDHVITAKRYRKKGKGREKTALAAARVDHLEDAVDGEDGFDIDAHHEQMESTFHALQRTFGALRSSGASTSMLDMVFVEAYGSRVPLKKIAQISVRDARFLEVRCLDDQLRSEVVQAIEKANLNLNPMLESSGKIAINVPKSTRESREKMKKLASEEAEAAKNIIRNLRRKGMHELKRLKSLSDLNKQMFEQQVEAVTADWIKKVDGALHAKKKDIDKV